MHATELKRSLAVAKSPQAPNCAHGQRHWTPATARRSRRLQPQRPLRCARRGLCCFHCLRHHSSRGSHACFHQAAAAPHTREDLLSTGPRQGCFVEGLTEVRVLNGGSAPDWSPRGRVLQGSWAGQLASAHQPCSASHAAPAMQRQPCSASHAAPACARCRAPSAHTRAMPHLPAACSG